MGTVKVILKQDIPNLGEEGDVREVKRGYARNFLFPKKFAVDYSLKNKNILEKQRGAIEKKRLAKKENANELKAKLESEKVEIEIAAGEKGRLYGTVTTMQIAESLAAKGFTIDRREVVLKEHIKFSGTYKYRIHLYQDIYAEMELVVIAKQEEKKADVKGKKRKKTAASKEDGAEESEVVETAEAPVENAETETAETTEA